jgi:hypothetical protein
LLEDSPMRIEWFKKKLPNLKVTTSVKEFKDYIDTKPRIDFIFFDHDLGDGGTGYEAAEFLTERFGRGINRWGLIHSWNTNGAKRMQELLPSVPHVVFGDFDIEVET